MNLGFSNRNRYVFHRTAEEKIFRVLHISECSYVVGMDIFSGTLNVADIGCHNIHIGKYTCIGSEVKLILDMSHDYHSLYQGIIPQFAMQGGERRGNGQILKRISRKGQILIGNDVWIGNGATILGGVRIGNGGVVAAGSVVVKDVPPYAIVGGNPATVIKYRFPKDVIDKLQRIAWWNWSSEEIAARKEDMQGEVKNFADKYDCKPGRYEKKKELIVKRIVEGVPLMVYFMDLEDEYPVYTNVVSNFIKTYHNLDAELLLCYDAKNSNAQMQMNHIIEILRRYEDVNAAINIFGFDMDEEEKIISEADVFITNRDGTTLRRVEYADRYGVDIISGVDIPVFR